MKVLTAGANTALAGSQSTWTLECDKSNAFGEYAAVALLPVNDKRQPVGTPALFHLEQRWMSWAGDPASVGCTLRLGELPVGGDRVLLAVYVYSSMGPVSELGAVRLVIDAQAEFRLDLRDYGDAAIIVGEFYLRNEQWKFRALAENSAYGLAALGRRMGIDIDEAHPKRRSAASDGSRTASSATGTAFAVGPNHVMTCAHVIEDMDSFEISSFEGRYKAEPVVVDRRNDIALLRVEGARPLVPIIFKSGSGCELGETIVALGFPLAGLAGGGVQVTQGGISGLFGLLNDSSLLQFTAPIQPGSSGSPLFDTRGAVVGMVTSSVPDAQNMNFAVKANLLLAFLDACRVVPVLEPSGRDFSTTEITRMAQPSLWQVNASRS